MTTDTENTWAAQFFSAEPTPDPMYELAREYVRRTEAFDRTVCRAWRRKDAEAMPTTPDEVHKVNLNARDVLGDLSRRPGVDRAALRRAISDYDRRPNWDDYREWGFDQPPPGAFIIED